MNQRTLSEVLEANALSLRPISTDYEKDGWLFCGICHRPKRYRAPGILINMELRCRCKERIDATEEREGF